MENNNLTFGKKLKKMLFSNWVIKLVSLAFALLIWSFVLTNLNPDRVKAVSGVSASFDGEADLIARRLVIRGNYEEIMSNVTVRVNTELIKYTDLNREDIICTVSLRNVNVAGEYDLRFEASSANGTVLGVIPDTIHVEIDKLSTRKIPIEVTGTGSVADGYYMGDPVLSRYEIEIEGPSTDIKHVSRAIANVDYSMRTADFKQSVSLLLVDESGNEISTSVLYGELPSVTVSIEILPKKEVNLNVMGAIIGLDTLNANQEVSSAYTVPNTVTIIGEREYLDQIDKIEISSIDITGVEDETIVKDVAVYIPAGVRIVGDIKKVTTYITVREKIVDKLFTAMNIKVVNLRPGLSYSITPINANVIVRGRISVINALQRKDIELYVNVDGLSADLYTLPLEFRLLNGKNHMELELTWNANVENISVVLR
ncbi:MAG: CdaR family protein [Clostridia bacterium]